jgi:hypothetical protein
MILLMENTKNDKFQITEMFIAKAELYRCFFGCVKKRNG